MKLALVYLLIGSVFMTLRIGTIALLSKTKEQGWMDEDGVRYWLAFAGVGILFWPISLPIILLSALLGSNPDIDEEGPHDDT